MSYITYHEWCKHLRDAAIIDQSVGKLELVAARSGVPLDRLKRWLAKDINLSHAEFISLHEVLAETHVLGSESNAESAEVEIQANTIGTPESRQRGCQSCEDSSITFDEDC